jgi:Flp pilus assembly protein TadG
MVEVAIVFPLLVMVALALVEFAIYYHAHNVVEAAVQEGARTAATLGGTEDDGHARAMALLRAGLSSNVHVDITVQRRGADTADDRVVAVADGSLPTFIPVFTFGRGPSHLDLPIRATAIVSKERFRGGP